MIWQAGYYRCLCLKGYGTYLRDIRQAQWSRVQLANHKSWHEWPSSEIVLGLQNLTNFIYMQSIAGDPGYWSTARMLLECGLVIALQVFFVSFVSC